MEMHDKTIPSVFVVGDRVEALVTIIGNEYAFWKGEELNVTLSLLSFVNLNHTKFKKI